MRRRPTLLVVLCAASLTGVAPAAACPDARWCFASEVVPGSADVLNPVLAVGGSAKAPYIHVAGDAPAGAGAHGPLVLTRGPAGGWSTPAPGSGLPSPAGSIRPAPSRLPGGRGGVAASGEHLYWLTSAQSTAALTQWTSHGATQTSHEPIVAPASDPACGAGITRPRATATATAFVLAGTTTVSHAGPSGGLVVIGVRPSEVSTPPQSPVGAQTSWLWHCFDELAPSVGPPAVHEFERNPVVAVPFVSSGDHPGQLALAVARVEDQGTTLRETVVFEGDGTAGTDLACNARNGNLGWVGFDAAGHRFAGAVGAVKNAQPGTSPEFHVWVNDREDPVKVTAPRAISSAWLVASPSAEGAFVVLGTPGPDGDCAARDLHVAQIDVDSDEVPVVGPVVPVARGVNAPCGSVAGAAIGPDGRLHLAVQAGSSDCTRPAGPGSPREVRLLSAPAPRSGRACRSATKRPSGRPRSARAQGAGLCRDGGRSRHAR